MASTNKSLHKTSSSKGTARLAVEKTGIFHKGWEKKQNLVGVVSREDRLYYDSDMKLGS